MTFEDPKRPGRRVLVSRQWSGKILTEHRADRRAVVAQVLAAAGIDPSDADRLAADQTMPDGSPRYVWADEAVDRAESLITKAGPWIRVQYCEALTCAEAISNVHCTGSSFKGTYTLEPWEPL